MYSFESVDIGVRTLSENLMPFYSDLLFLLAHLNDRGPAIMIELLMLMSVKLKQGVAQCGFAVVTSSRQITRSVDIDIDTYPDSGDCGTPVTRFHIQLEGILGWCLAQHP